MGKCFFKPYVGSEYHKGINGKKVLVLGASFYCSKKECQFFAECTNPVQKDSSKFDTCCPAYTTTGQRLSEEPTNAIEDGYRTYQIFGTFMQQFLNEGTEDVWQRMAFTDYMQFFSPTIDTKKEYLSRRDFEAFNETLAELQPDVVVVWGTAIIEEIRDKNLFVTDLERLSETEWYVFHIRLPQVPHDIVVVNCYHPSSMSHWYNNLDTFAKYMRQVLG